MRGALEQCSIEIAGWQDVNASGSAASHRQAPRARRDRFATRSPCSASPVAGLDARRCLAAAPRRPQAAHEISFRPRDESPGPIPDAELEGRE